MRNEDVKYFTGLDLGQSAEFTGLAVLERTISPDAERPGRTQKRYAVRHLERFPLGTPFPELCARLGELFSGPPLARSTLVVDLTAVGQPVLDLLRRRRLPASIQPVTITAGDRASIDERGVWSAPKKELVSTLQLLLQSRRISVASTLPESGTLARELVRFRTKATVSSNDALEVWRERPHDDLVLAVAIAAWQGERPKEFWVM
jgi:hypothetical protein